LTCFESISRHWTVSCFDLTSSFNKLFITLILALVYSFFFWVFDRLDHSTPSEPHWCGIIGVVLTKYGCMDSYKNSSLFVISSHIWSLISISLNSNFGWNVSNIYKICQEMFLSVMLLLFAILFVLTASEKMESIFFVNFFNLLIICQIIYIICFMILGNLLSQIKHH